MENEIVKPLILIVDDPPTNIQVLAEALREDDRVKVATSGQAALDLIDKQGPPDLILLDVMMPRMDGFEVCIRLKQNPATKQIPVIFVTAKNEAADEEFGLKLGAVDYISKPFHLPIVKARVQNHLTLKLKTDLLESMAMLDGLTNIPNRRRFDEALDVEWKRALRAGSSLAIIMMDIDFFKNYNDRYGHGVGDACLKKVASALAVTVSRPGDLVARYGGEEFVVLLPETGAEGARLLAENLCNQIEALKIPHEYSGASTWVTISVGYASATPSQEGKESELLDAADQMLYRAKESGRNRVYG
ncbi:MAG: diguanylate cyclase [Sulfuricella sp.]